jgi:hypothetical protein
MEGLGNFVLCAPRGGPFSLQQRCMWALTYSSVSQIDGIIMRHSLKHIDSILDEVRHVFVFCTLEIVFRF